MKQLEARRLNQFFAEHMTKASSNWRLNPHLLIELTCVEQVGAITRDANNDNIHVDLRQKMFESKNILFIPFDSKSSLFKLYFDSNTNEVNNKFRGTVVVFKDKKGKRQTVEVSRYHYGNQAENISTLARRFGTDLDVTLIESILDDLQSSRPEVSNEIKALLETKSGIKIETVMTYTHCLWISPKYLKQNKQGLEIGWMTNSTYSSHPVVLKITKRTKSVELIRLADIGAESSGYYDHSNKHTCTREEAFKIKAFAKRFKNNSKKGISK